MNNLFVAYTISIPGVLLDNLKFNQYTDYNSTSTSDAQALAKAVAYVRNKHLARALSKFSVPVYCTTVFGTAGNASSVPTDATITVGYISIEPFLSQLTTPPAPADRFTAAGTVIHDGVVDALNDALNELTEIQVTSERKQYASGSSTETMVSERIDYVAVPAVTPTVTVSLKL